MEPKRLSYGEARFLDIIWDSEPVPSGKLVELCREKLDWKKSTTYTRLRIEIKKNAAETAYAASAFPVLDKVEDKKRGMGAVVSMCPAPGMLRENVLEIPVWYI